MSALDWTIQAVYKTRPFGKTQIAERTGIPHGTEQAAIEKLRTEIGLAHPDGKIIGVASSQPASPKEIN